MLSCNHSEQLLFGLRMGFGVGVVSMMDVGQPRAVPVSPGQVEPESEGAQCLDPRAGGCEGGSHSLALLLLAAGCSFAITEHAANYNQTMSNHSPLAV